MFSELDDVGLVRGRLRVNRIRNLDDEDNVTILIPIWTKKYAAASCLGTLALVGVGIRNALSDLDAIIVTATSIRINQERRFYRVAIDTRRNVELSKFGLVSQIVLVFHFWGEAD